MSDLTFLDKLQWLRENTHSVTIRLNEHRVLYQSTAEYVEGLRYPTLVGDLERDSLVEVRICSDSSGYASVLVGSDLSSVIDAAFDIAHRDTNPRSGRVVATAAELYALIEKSGGERGDYVDLNLPMQGELERWYGVPHYEVDPSVPVFDEYTEPSDAYEIGVSRVDYYVTSSGFYCMNADGAFHRLPVTQVTLRNEALESLGLRVPPSDPEPETPGLSPHPVLDALQEHWPDAEGVTVSATFVPSLGGSQVLLTVTIGDPSVVHVSSDPVVVSAPDLGEKIVTRIADLAVLWDDPAVCEERRASGDYCSTSDPRTLAAVKEALNL